MVGTRRDTKQVRWQVGRPGSIKHHEGTLAPKVSGGQAKLKDRVVSRDIPGLAPYNRNVGGIHENDGEIACSNRLGKRLKGRSARTENTLRPYSHLTFAI